MGNTTGMKIKRHGILLFGLACLLAWFVAGTAASFAADEGGPGAESVERYVTIDFENVDINLFIDHPALDSTLNVLENAGVVIDRVAAHVAAEAGDVIVAGEIMHSDGESMSLKIWVSDATGLEWFEETYSAQASKFSYEAGRNHSQFWLLGLVMWK